MSKKKICFIAQFPPPIHGLSKAVDTLYYSELQNDFEFEKIDITNNMHFFSSCMAIIQSKADLFYFTISQTAGGNLRDLIILKLLGIQQKKCLVHLHGGYYRNLVDIDLPAWQKKANYIAISKIEGVIVLGKSLKHIFEGMIAPERIYTVPNCIDNEFLLSDKEFDEKIKTVECEQVHHVLWLSNFIKSKGYPIVLEMAKLEKKRVENGGKKSLHFDFAGGFFEKSEEVSFLNRIVQDNLEQYITYHGRVLGEEKKKLLKKCLFFVLPTCYPKEGQPICILEAMGNGGIVLTTNHAGIPDIVEETNGIIVDKDSIEMVEVSKMYNYCLKATDSLKPICYNNREKIKSQYSEELYINKFKNVLLHIFEEDI